ncbi:hypothetical protein [Streptomyces sp. NPDC059994]|uniref:hypothetical protein n=1 Tax=Streptomyces sp. NPDC059994 TaxID=3347029 RepID=UPI0036BB3C0F
MSIDPNPIGLPPRSRSDWDVPLADVEAEIVQISARAHAAQPNPDGAHVECWHQFLDIDPDLRGRDYAPKTERTHGGAS